MYRLRAWSVAAAVTAAVLSLPAVVAHLPVSDPGVTAGALLAKVRASSAVSYSGYAESLGTLALPSGRTFTELTDLFGSQTRLRVWWRGPADWRVDSLAAAGEHGAYRDSGGVWMWDFEADRATRINEPAYRPPISSDLVPAELGRRLLSEATVGELRRIPALRIAGRTAAGLRMRPAQPDSTVDRVDTWIDPASGLPLRVEIWAKHARQPALRSSFLDLDVARPDAALTRFVPAAGSRVTGDSEFDLEALAAEYGNGAPPARLIGLPLRRDTSSLGTYGRGPVLLAAVPLPGGLGGRLSYRLSGAPGTQVSKDGRTQSLSVGPLSLLVTTQPDRTWLLTGTVTVAALRRAAAELTAGTG